MHIVNTDSLNAETAYRREQLTRAWRQPAAGSVLWPWLMGAVVRRWARATASRRSAAQPPGQIVACTSD